MECDDLRIAGFVYRHGCKIFKKTDVMSAVKRYLKFAFHFLKIKFLDALAKFRKATVSFVMDFCLSACMNSTATGRILIFRFFPEDPSRNFKFH